MKRSAAVMRALLYGAHYLVILTREILAASISVTRLALGPIERLRSGFLALPMDASSDLEVTALANSITLTPGTITVHVDPALKTIVIHAIDIGLEPDDVRKSIKSVLEANILLCTRAVPRRRRSRA